MSTLIIRPYTPLPETPLRVAILFVIPQIPVNQSYKTHAKTRKDTQIVSLAKTLPLSTTPTQRQRLSASNACSSSTANPTNPSDQPRINPPQIQHHISLVEENKRGNRDDDERQGRREALPGVVVVVGRGDSRAGRRGGGGAGGGGYMVCQLRSGPRRQR